jgi:hypothetical protein
MRTFSLLLCSLLLVGTISAAQAQGTGSDESASPAYTKGLFLHGRLGGHGLTLDGTEVSSGRGIGAKLGYGFSPILTLYLGLDIAGMDVANNTSLDGTATNRSIASNTYALALIDLGFQLNFLSKSGPLVPYVDGALTGVGAGYETGAGTAVYSGSGVSLGGGLKYFVTPSVALDGGARFLFGDYQQLEVDRQDLDVELDVVSAQLHAGITVYLFR